MTGSSWTSGPGWKRVGRPVAGGEFFASCEARGVVAAQNGGWPRPNCTAERQGLMGALTSIQDAGVWLTIQRMPYRSRMTPQ